MHIGIDLVKTSRFNHFSHIEKIFTEQEQLYLKKCQNHAESLAGMYAAKEACLKAMKMGIHKYSLLDIEILHDENKAPFLILHGQIKKETSYSNMEVSISHDGDYTIAVVLLSD